MRRYALCLRVGEEDKSLAHRSPCSHKNTFVGNILEWASLAAQWSRIHLLMQETQVPSLSLEDPLEKELSTHSSVLAWEIPWTEEAGGLKSMALQESHTTE